MDQNPNIESWKRIHFIGIGGAGMGGIAEVLANQGYEISGSDLCENAVTQHLRSLGVNIFIGHAKENVVGVEVVVVSSAIPEDNAELIAAKNAKIPVIPRAKMLALLMKTRYGIAVSGTHGKTTTTSLIASVLAEGGLDPTFVIGGLLKSAGTNARLGSSPYFVAEADESDASFLYLKPQIAVVTNIDSDHLSTYKDDINCLRQSFLDFISYIPDDGLAVICIDDPIAASLCSELEDRSYVTYGFSEKAAIQAYDFKQQGLRSHFRVRNKLENYDDAVELNLAGKHNVTNALATIAVARQLNVASSDIYAAFKQFLGIGRRFQMYGEFDVKQGRVLLIDDYGHHPREIDATLEAIRLVWPKRRVVMAYQPHRYTRTKALMNDFASVLSKPDVLLLLDVYSAGEQPIHGADGAALCQAITGLGILQPVFVPRVDELPVILQSVLKDGDILLMQGAGNIGSMAARIAETKLEIF